jgi:hypothetical protein
MVQARIHKGKVEVQDPIPPTWEGQIVKIVPLTPDDPLPDLDRLLAELHALGPMEYEPGEREAIERELEAHDRLSQQNLDDLKHS